MAEPGRSVSAAEPLRQFRRYPQYRDSGVEWLGEIPVGWHVEQLKRVARVNPDSLREDTDPALQIAYVDIGSVNSQGRITERESLAFAEAPSRARRVVQDGDVIVSTVRTYLRAIALIRDPEPGTIVSTGFAVVRLEERLLPSFAAYALRSPFFVERVVANSKGVSFPAISESEMACFELAIPPRSEQRPIAAFLDRETARIDSLVAMKERLIELLQEKRTALITRAVTKGLDPNVRMKDPGVEWLGEIPAHWAPSRVRDVAESLQTGPFGSQLHAEEYVQGGLPVINPANLQLGTLVEDPECTVSDETAQRLERHRLQSGDVLFARRGDLGRCGLVEPGQEGWLCGTGCLRARLRFAAVVPRFLLRVLSGPGVAAWLNLQSVGATMQNLNTSIIGRIAVPLPPLHEQNAIVEFLDEQTSAHGALITKIQEAIARLRELRTALVSAAVTGKIDVREEVA